MAIVNDIKFIILNKTNRLGINWKIIELFVTADIRLSINSSALDQRYIKMLFKIRRLRD